MKIFNNRQILGDNCKYIQNKQSKEHINSLFKIKYVQLEETNKKGT